MNKEQESIVTSDFSRFGSRERGLAKDLLVALSDQGFPYGFNEDEVTINMNTNSGYVFFSNSDYQVCMMNGDKLELFYSCPNCGNEGFQEDHNFNESGYCEDCKDKE